MKIPFLTLLVLIISWIRISAQDTLVMPITGNGGIYNSCYAVIYDNGIDSNYKNYSHSTITIAPLWVEDISLYFEEFETEIFFDSLTIYDGPGITFPVIGTYSGTSLQGQTIYSTGNSITLAFRSDDIQTGRGFKVWVNCTMSSEEFNSDAVILYPNPARDEILIKELDATAISNIRIFDCTGSIVGIKESNTSIDTENLQPGLYVIHILLVNGKIIRKKFIRE